MRVRHLLTGARLAHTVMTGLCLVMVPIAYAYNARYGLRGLGVLHALTFAGMAATWWWCGRRLMPPLDRFERMPLAELFAAHDDPSLTATDQAAACHALRERIGACGHEETTW